MPPKRSISVPTNAALLDDEHLPTSDPIVAKTLSRFSRQALLELVLEWLDPDNREVCSPYLAPGTDVDEDEEAPYRPAETIEEVIESYQELKARKGGVREVVDRILHGDWRKGITLYQLAMAETRYLISHMALYRWNTLELHKITGSSSAADDSIGCPDESPASRLPRFNPTTFVLNLKAELASAIKAHYYMVHIKALEIYLLRVKIHNSPYNQPLFDNVWSSASYSSKPVYMLFPCGAPYIYVSSNASLSQKVGSRCINASSIVIDAVPKALSRPHCRYMLKPAQYCSRNITALLSMRGPGRGNAAPAAWSIFAENSYGHHLLDYNIGRDHNPRSSSQTDVQERKVAERDRKPAQEPKDDAATQKRQRVAQCRFGSSAKEDDSKGLERLDIRIEDTFDLNVAENADDHGSVCNVLFSFQGSHIFSGMRQLVERGVVDGEMMPGWMAGDAGVSVGVVRHGRVRRKD